MRTRSRSTRLGTAVVALLVLSLVAAACGSSSKKSGGSTETTAKSNGTARGFDGTTLTLAGMGIKAQFPGAEWGIQGRIKRFNDSNELPGVKLSFAEYADDKQDPATALSEARRLVSEVKAFAIVGDTSQSNPGDYFKQQQVPFFGWAFDDTYCTDSTTPDTNIWGFGFNGCLVPKSPKVMPDAYGQIYDYVSKQTGKQKPTVASFSSDSQSGRDSTAHSAPQLAGAGFDVVFTKGNVPLPPVSDYTPYVQQLMTADHGKAPDVLVCLLAIDCIPMYKGLVAAGFKGTYFSNLYSDALLAPMKGSYASVPFVAFDQPSDGLTQLKKDVAAVKADQAIDTGVTAGYFTTDMFIQALVAAAKSGGITPANVRAKAASQTWGIKGFIGPYKYPDSTVKSTPACRTLVYDDGTSWKTVVPYACSDKGFPVTGS